MRLFLSGETECLGKVFLDLLRNVDNKLTFVTEENAGLEKLNNYGTEFEDIGIITIIVSKRLIDSGVRERKYISRKNKSADIRLFIDYEQFVNATPEKQRLLYIRNIIDSINVVIEKSKGDFRGEDLKRDILKALDVTQEQLDNL